MLGRPVLGHGSRLAVANKPVFFDASGRRALGASIVGWTAGVISLILGAVFVYSLINAQSGVQPRLPGHLTAGALRDLEKTAKAPALVRAAARLANEARARREELAVQRRLRNERGLRARPLASILKPGS